MIKSQVIFTKSLPLKSQFNFSTILLFDEKNLKNPIIKKWISRFPFSIGIKAGELLKTGPSYLKTIDKIQKIVTQNSLSSSELTFIALGGGSVGDFVGFVASTFQRGKKLVIIPTTWLAAVDSAHGGKNGLNLNHVKNQIGTFYPASQIFLSKKILQSLPEESMNDALSEALKMGLISDSHLFNSLNNNFKSFWNYLPRIVESKYKIVNKDPEEKTGFRRILNLGHTLGHVFESVHGLTHGQSVFLGILFSARFSLNKGYLSWNEFTKIIDQMFKIKCDISYQEALNMPIQKVETILRQDKKKTSQDQIDFIFISRVGKVKREKVLISDLMAEIKRQQREI